MEYNYLLRRFFQEKGIYLSEEHYDLVKQCMPWVDKISKRLEIYDKKVSPKRCMLS